MALTLLALWAPVTVHCALEATPGFSFLQSCCGQAAAPQSRHDCSQDSCGGVESGCYKIEDNPTVAPALALLLAFASWDWIAEPATDSAPDFIPATSAPPELPRLWQFHHRTALPPRAPSFAS